MIEQRCFELVIAIATVLVLHHMKHMIGGSIAYSLDRMFYFKFWTFGTVTPLHLFTGKIPERPDYHSALGQAPPGEYPARGLDDIDQPYGCLPPRLHPATQKVPRVLPSGIGACSATPSLHASFPKAWRQHSVIRVSGF